MLSAGDLFHDLCAHVMNSCCSLYTRIYAVQFSVLLAASCNICSTPESQTWSTLFQ